ncbi:hypothetical protein I4641_00505 [Waterburya agarophytonicola K14]|uniref:Uncharacterized protein n=1 Tax=Waterburya agarophytonicola KI4 TaxID=2874699 RepID=A0A964BMP9_9CYAN|nr:hypothetical protein [Waterburya agarophytonicola]MCC0175461.1 hypothetical protein [Waterburya agarophytonicola KI4]
MDTLQVQISELREKIDKLHELIEQISQQVKTLSSQEPKNRSGESYSLPNFASGSANKISQNGESEYQLTHKDILVDDNSSTSTASSGSDNFSPDTQIRRLTAQLTAAYNRIAALEEQLLTYRIHS